MEDQLSTWLNVLPALGTVAIALLGVAIAWGQWTTARSKLILDLYEHRREVYSELLGPVAKALQTMRPEAETLGDFVKIVDRAQFLFGRDVLDYINEYRNLLSRLIYASSMLQSDRITPEQRERYLQLQMEAFTAFDSFYSGLVKRMAPYMLMDQKRPWTISRIPRWFGWRGRQLWNAAAAHWARWRKKRPAKPA